jgi:flagellar protein FliS
MHSNAHDEYLVTQVMTATPQKLHLMLIEAALRECERTRRHWNEEKEDSAAESLTKAQEIVTELLASLNFTEQPELIRRIASVYNFVFRSLVTAQVRQDDKSLADATRLLEIERETWRQVVQTTAPQTTAARHAAHGSHSVPAPARMTDVPTSSLSFEA